MGPILLSNFQVNRQIEQKCLSPFGYRNFGILADPTQSLIWRGHRVNGNHLLIVPKSREVEAICFPGFKFYTISIEENWLEKLSESQQYHNNILIDSHLELLLLRNKLITKIRTTLQRIFFEFDQHPSLIQNQIFLNNAVDELTNNLFDSDLKIHSIPKLPSKRIRDVALQRALDCIHAKSIDWPSIINLSEFSGASQRTLEYAFKEKYGFGPKEYLIKHHLNRVYKSIKKSNPSTTKIKDLAQNCGFWHMGQFGIAYKNLFGELPSSTLNKV